jgi:hypothetical protein
MSDDQSLRERIEPATVTVGRARRFYQILCDLDFDAAIDEAQQARQEEVTGRPVGIAEQAAHDAGESVSEGDEDSETQTVAIKTNALMETLMTEGKLTEMAEVILNLPDDVDSDEVPIDLLVEAFPDFIVAYAELISAVAGTAGATPSA